MNKKQRWLLIFAFWSTTTGIYSQSLAEFKYLGEIYGANESYLGLYPTYTFVSNPLAPRPENHKLKGWTGELSFRQVDFKQGKLRWSWQHKMLVDVFLILDQALQKGNPNAIYRAENTSVTNGVIGWLDFIVNVNKPDGRFLLAIGANHNDYFYGSTYHSDTANWISPEPQGYYFAAGPTVTMNFLPLNFLMVEASGSYSFSYWKAVDISYATNPDPAYPMPHWGQIDLELQTKWGFFTGFNYNWIINKGSLPAAGRRLDLLLGFRFMI